MKNYLMIRTKGLQKFLETHNKMSVLESNVLLKSKYNKGNYAMYAYLD